MKWDCGNGSTALAIKFLTADLPGKHIMVAVVRVMLSGFIVRILITAGARAWP
jgi:hypothetical protein